jgi:asparagine synthase (glutamine-hydrolysing)
VEINKFMDKKIENEQMLVKEIQEVSNEFNVSVKQPFLSCGFIEYAKKIPLDKKIRSSNDLLRKHILREVAILLNVPVEAALQPKKALQYGSLIHKNLIKGIKKEDEIRKLLLTKINH